MDPHNYLTCKGTQECIDGAFNTLNHKMKTATPSEQFQNYWLKKNAIKKNHSRSTRFSQKKCMYIYAEVDTRQVSI
jgi:hypothetical protein